MRVSNRAISDGHMANSTARVAPSTPAVRMTGLDDFMENSTRGDRCQASAAAALASSSINCSEPSSSDAASSDNSSTVELTRSCHSGWWRSTAAAMSLSVNLSLMGYQRYRDAATSVAAVTTPNSAHRPAADMMTPVASMAMATISVARAIAATANAPRVSSTCRTRRSETLSFAASSSGNRS